ncbi:MAG: single-stranded DNA-binding protein [Planctomycetota bacterium]|jgi:single-strand DNA-binding protein
MANLNKVFLMGNLTRDPELRYLQSGSAIVKFGLAVNRKYRKSNSQEWVEETTFVDVEGWGKQAETFNQYMSKGRPVFVEGRLRLDQWESKEGQRRSKLVIVMENFQFLGSGAGAGREAPARRTDSAPQGQIAEGGKSAGGEDYDFNDIPF